MSSANIFHSGSILKSQCERLFGSFHNITASTICHFPRSPLQCSPPLLPLPLPLLLIFLSSNVCRPTSSLQCPIQLHVVNILPIARSVLRLADPRLRLGMRNNRQ